MIFTGIATAISGALFAGSVLATKVLASVLAFGTSLAYSYLTRPKGRSYGASSAVQGSIEFGARVDAATMYGTGKVMGHRIYYAKWGKGNVSNANVDILANGWCDGLEPYVFFYGKKHNLVVRDPSSNEVAHYGVEGYGTAISIRLYDGRPGQLVDEDLVTSTAALGRNWKSTSICAGHCYVVIVRHWSAELFDKGEPQFEWVLRGLRLYDPRKDDTVAGGDGDHRIDDPETWEHSLNPALQRFNFQIGLRGLISTRVLIGEGKSMGQLDLGSYIAAMNVCDTIREGKPTYQSTLWVTSDDDHTEILKEFDDAMCGYGMNRRGLSGVIAGAPQTPVLELGANDIDLRRQKTIKFRKSAFDLYNNFSGQFMSPAAFWNPESLDPIKVNQDVSDDGREHQIANDFLQITDPDIAQYCLQIRYRQNRKGGSATIPVSRRVGFKVEEGNWITYLDRSWLVTNWSMDEKMQFTLTLAETGADVYSSGGIVPGPIIVPPSAPVNPSILSTVQDFNIEVGTIEGEDDTQVPSLRFSWTPPEDPTITKVRFEYFVGETPVGDAYQDSTDDPEAGEYVTSKNVIAGVFYTSRATITTVPDRFRTWTAYATTELPTANAVVPIDLPARVEALLQRVEEIEGRLSSRDRLLEQNGEATAINSVLIEELRGLLSQGLGSVLGESKAAAEIALQVATSATTALSQFFVGVFAQTASGTVESFVRLQALSSPEGVLARFAIMLRASIVADEWKESGFEIAIVETEQGLQSVISMTGDQIYLNVGGVPVPASGLLINNEVYEVEVVDGKIIIPLETNHAVYKVLVSEPAMIMFPTGAKVGRKFDIIIKNVEGLTDPITYDPTYIIVDTVLEQPSTSPLATTIYTAGISEMLPRPEMYIEMIVTGATTTTSERQFSFTPPLPGGKNTWDLEEDGPFEYDGEDASDVTVTIVPTGDRLDCDVEIWGVGGTSGSVQLSNPADPEDAEDTTFGGGSVPMLTAGAGKSSPSVQQANPSSPFGAAGPGGAASGGDTNTAGVAGGNNGNGGTTRRFCGRGAAAPNGGEQIDPLYVVPGPGKTVIKHGVEGNSPGGGARGCGSTSSTSNYHGFSGGGGSGGYVKNTYDVSTPLLQGVTYTAFLPHPADPITAVSTNPAQGKRGGRARIRIT
jgi:hypothetical protein